MPHRLSTNICLPFNGRLGRDATNEDTQLSRVQNHPPCDGAVAHDEFQVEDGRPPNATSIHILDDDSLLNIFCLYRPVLPEENEGDNTSILDRGEWGGERWWYKPAHVCRRWRRIILASASYLGLRLVCTYGTPVVDMLARFPPFPLIVDYVDKDRGLTAGDEEGIWHALQHRDRLRRIRLWVPNSYLRKLVAAIDGEFPALEYLFLGFHQKPDTRSGLMMFHDTFQAPCLRHLMFIRFPFPVISPSLSMAVGVVTLSLNFVPHLHPYDLLGRLSLMPHLETLEISLPFHLSTYEPEVQQLHTPPLIHVTLASLRRFVFKGSSVYLEALLPGMTNPLLEKLQITFFNQRTFSVPCLLHYISKADNLYFSCARFSFTSGGVAVSGYSHEGVRTCVFFMHVLCVRLNWQVSSMAQISNVLKPVFCSVSDLTLDYGEHILSLDQHDEAGNTEWNHLLRSFNNVRTLHVHGGLVGALSHSLRWNQELLLPELKEVVCPGEGHASDELISSINGRKVTCQAVQPVRTEISGSPPKRSGKSRCGRLGRFSRLWP